MGIIRQIGQLTGHTTKRAGYPSKTPKSPTTFSRAQLEVKSPHDKYEKQPFGYGVAKYAPWLFGGLTGLGSVAAGAPQKVKLDEQRRQSGGYRRRGTITPPGQARESGGLNQKVVSPSAKPGSTIKAPQQ